MESYKKYVDEVRQKGTACDIARAASGLHDRADELLMFNVIERTMADLGHADVTFTSSNFVIDDVNKTIGQLRGKGGELYMHFAVFYTLLRVVCHMYEQLALGLAGNFLTETECYVRHV